MQSFSSEYDEGMNPRSPEVAPASGKSHQKNEHYLKKPIQ